MFPRKSNSINNIVVCRPEKEYFKIDEKEKHNISDMAEPERAQKQHDRLCSIISNFGCRVSYINELEGHPNSVFTRDTAVCTSDGFINLRMGLESRRGEEKWIADYLVNMGLFEMENIKKPGTVEGGDIILSYPHAFIGLSQRTNEEGVKQIFKILKKAGYQVKIQEVNPPFLHLGGMMSVLDGECILTCVPGLDSESKKKFRVIETDFNSTISGNVIAIDEGKIIAEESGEKTVNILMDAGFQVSTVNLSEFIKGSGGPSCLVLPVE